MFILDLWGDIRSIFFWIEGAGFAFIDNAYRVFISLAKGNLFDPNIVKHILSRMYIVVGIFALFRIALLLVNSIINPDNFNKEKAGVSKIFINTVIMLVLLVMVPTIFSWSRDLTAVIVDNNLIQKVFNNSGSTGKDVNPGYEMQRIALGAIIKINDNIEWYANDKKHNEKDYVEPGNSSDCPSCDSGNDNDDYKAINCILALQDGKVDGNANKNSGDTEGNLCLMSGKDKYGNSIEGKVNWSAVSDHNGNYTKKGGGKTYIYESPAFLILAIGIFITYVLLSFSFDIAKRMLELAVLEILSPLFIATYVDPKSAESGPFKKWLTACGKSYASLFIRLAVIALMLLAISLIRKIDWPNGLGFFGGLILLIAILIFFKQAPKWISGLIGLDGDDAGLGGLGIGKKLAGAALIGGGISKGLESAKKFGDQKAKNFGANRIRNTAARVGGMKEALADNRKKKKDGILTKDNRQSLWKQGRAASKKSRADNWGADAQGLIKDIGAGYMGGRLNVNPGAESLNAKMKGNVETKAKDYNNKIGNTAAARAKAQEIADNIKEAKKLYGSDNVAISKNPDGDRLKVDNGSGKEVYLNPRNGKEMNESFKNPRTEEAAFEAHGNNLITASNGEYSVDSSTGKVLDSKGKVLANSVAEFGASKMDYAGRLAVKDLVTENVKSDISRYQTGQEKLQQASTDYSTAVVNYNAAIQALEQRPEVRNARLQIGNYESIVTRREEARNTILKTRQEIQNLEGMPNRTTQEEARLVQLRNIQKDAIATVNTTNHDIKVMDDKYQSAKQTISAAETEVGVEQMKVKIDSTRKIVDEWSKDVKELEKKFKTTEAYTFEEDGTPKKKENPYNIVVDGEELNPVDNYVRIDEISNAFSIKASKSKSKYEKAMKESTEDKK